VIDFGIRKAFLDAGENGGIGGGSAVVVAEENVERIGAGADDGDGFDFCGVERKRVPVVFKEDDRFAGRFEREFAVSGRVDIRESEF